LLWHSGINLSIQQSTPYMIHASIIDNGTEWDLVCFYGQPNRTQRREFWLQSSAMLSSVNKPLLCCGDFNDLLQIRDKYGGTQVHHRNTANLRMFVNNLALIDLGFSGPAFTWSNNQRAHSHVRERLDRAFSNADWNIIYPNASVNHLPHFSSDHCPILINLLPPDVRRRRHFMFENHWVDHPQYHSVFQEPWRGGNRSNSGSFWSKLTHTKKKLTSWNDKTFREIPKKVKHVQEQLLQVQSLPISDANLAQEQELHCDLTRLLRIEDCFWRQRAKVKWQAEGDVNSKFFHLAALKRRRKNKITQLALPSGNITLDSIVIIQQFIDYYSDLFGVITASPFDFRLMRSSVVFSDQETVDLISIPTVAEIKEVLFSMGSFKSPGHDGLNAHFYKTEWPIISDELCVFIQDFFITRVMPPHINHTLITLIPKKSVAVTPKDFRPISLCTVLYKVIAKIIANKFKGLLDRCISKNQSAFIPGRSIFDNCILTQELLHSMSLSKKQEGLLALKLDLEKAYDKVDWQFISGMLSYFGFPDLFISWIMECLTTVTYSVIINGQRHGHIIPKRGIRQGCPLSPYLFVFVTEFLSLNILELQ